MVEDLGKTDKKHCNLPSKGKEKPEKKGLIKIPTRRIWNKTTSFIIC